VNTSSTTRAGHLVSSVATMIILVQLCIIRSVLVSITIAKVTEL
jgi:hypothetical protein